MDGGDVNIREQYGEAKRDANQENACSLEIARVRGGMR
jgi:hypothetical protein